MKEYGKVVMAHVLKIGFNGHPYQHILDNIPLTFGTLINTKYIDKGVKCWYNMTQKAPVKLFLYHLFLECMKPGPHHSFLYSRL